ncbi:MAG TPA: hypothetical protein VEC36_06415 [Patescibacteria group bacterium]|nr:hypothetical protein [Patescibacteria group bacterium]
MQDLLRFFDHQECPSVDGIVYPDGSIFLLNISIDWGRPANYSVKKGAKTTVDGLKGEGELYWTSCAVLVSMIDTQQSIEIWGGEASYGSDGFVSVFDLSSKNLIWIAFFNESNPFDKLSVLDDEIYATSTNGCVWKIKIKNPVDIVVECR